MDDFKEITFFKPAYRKKEYRSPDQSRRKLLVALLVEGKQLTRRKLAFKAGVAGSTAYEILPDLVKFGAVKPLPIAKKTHRQDSAYTLTKDGLALALVIAWEEKTLGVDYPALLQQVFQPNPEDDPITILADYVILNAVGRGLTEYSLRFILAGVKAKENGAESDWRKAALGNIVATKEESKAIKECYLSAFSNLTEQDRLAAYSYYKGEVEEIILRLAQRARNRQLMMTVLESRKDPEKLIMPFGCGRCDYQNKQAELPMATVLSDAFTKGGLTCPKCGRVTKSKKKANERLISLMVGAVA